MFRLSVLPSFRNLGDTIPTNFRQALQQIGSSLLIRAPYEFENRQSQLFENQQISVKTKSYVWLQEEMWVGFLVLAGLIVFMCVICLAILFVQWRR